MSTKKLQELLQDQQEPFTLELYLLERGYSKNKLDPNQSFLCFSTSSSKFLKRSASSGLNKGRNLLPIFSKSFRAIFNKLVSINLRIKSPKSSDQENGKRNQENQEEDRFSSASSTTVFNSCSDSDTEEVGRERKFNKKKQLSAVSVLEEILSHETSPFHNGKNVETSIISNTVKAKKIDMGVLQTNQLLYDCVREAIETRRRKYAIGRQMQFQEFLGAEETGKIIFENMKEWSKQCVDKNEMTEVLNLGLIDSREEWSDFEEERNKISMVIGDFILEDISNEFVTEIMCN